MRLTVKHKQIGVLTLTLVLLITQALAPGIPGIFFLNGLLVSLCAVVVFVRSRQAGRGPARRFWQLLAAGIACWSAGELVWQAQNMAVGHATPFPSLADIGYGLAWACFLAALLLLTRGRRPMDAKAYLLDVLILLLGPATAVWIWAIYPALHDGTHDLLDISAALAYPLTDIALVVLIVRALMLSSRRNRALAVLSWGLFAFVAGDILFAVMVVNDWNQSSLWGGLWPLGFALMAIAALRPDMTAVLPLSEATDGEGSMTPSAAILAPITISAIAIPLAALAAWWLDIPRQVPAVSLVAVLMLLLIMLRVTLMVKASERQNRKLEAALGELAAERSARGRLIIKTLETVEAERKFVAAEIHDGPVQVLAALAYMLDATQPDADPQQMAQDVKGQLRNEIRSLRRIMSELRPPALDEQGLAAAMQNLADDFRSTHAIELDLDLQLPGRLPEAIELVVYRLVQESLANIAKHAQASHVFVQITTDAEALQVCIQDDGCGFDLACAQGASEGHFGLAIMRERVEMVGGSWQIVSQPQAGTRVRAELPLASAAHKEHADAG